MSLNKLFIIRWKSGGGSLKQPAAVCGIHLALLTEPTSFIKDVGRESARLRTKASTHPAPMSAVIMGVSSRKGTTGHCECPSQNNKKKVKSSFHINGAPANAKNNLEGHFVRAVALLEREFRVEVCLQHRVRHGRQYTGVDGLLVSLSPVGHRGALSTWVNK